jgi:ABC-2 type transport system ATP-binding protein
VIINHGRLVASGSPSELTASGAESQLSFRARPGLALEELLAKLPAGMSGREGTPGHYTLRGTVDPPLLAAVTAWCAENGVLAEDLRVQQRSLEDVFVELTGDFAARTPEVTP